MPRKKLSYGKRDKCTTERPAVFGVKRFNGKETGWKDNGPPIETIQGQFGKGHCLLRCAYTFRCTRQGAPDLALYKSETGPQEVRGRGAGRKQTHDVFVLRQEFCHVIS